MSFGTSLIHETYFNRATYNYLYEVEQAIEEEQSLLDNARSEILNYAVMTEPSKMLYIEEGCNPIDVLVSNVKESLNQFEESCIKLSRLNDLKENWDQCHITINGVSYAKPPNENEYPRLTGDFIKTVPEA